MKSLSFLIVFFLTVSISFVQAQELKLFDPSRTANNRPKKSQQKLAIEYYSAGDYKKAVELFETLYEKNKSSYYYKYLLYCYVNLEAYSKAERMIKKSARKNHKAYKQLADLGYIQLKKGKTKKAASMFNKAIDELPANKAAVNELAGDFRARGQYDLALETYFKGKELLKSEYSFQSELGYLYYFLEQYNHMTDAYLNLLASDPQQMRTVQFRIQGAFRRDKEDVVYPYLKTELLKRIKKEPEIKQYRELLMWLSIQRRDFNIALIQAKSLDKTGGNDAYRVFDLSKIILSNNDYHLSIQALEYLLKLPNANDQIYYFEARQLLLRARFLQFQLLKPPTKKDIDNLQDNFDGTINELGKNKYTIQSVMDYAEFLSFYQDNPDQAILELESLLATKGLNKVDKAPIKLLLGNLYLLSDNPWDATLLYSQVDKDFKNDEIGFEAKLRNAYLSFYIGEFDWAKAQLDILKASTGKKIANDAMRLSLFVTENLDADSNVRALELYGRAELLHLQKQDSLAFKTYDSIFMLSLSHEIFDDVWYRKAEILIESNQYKQARFLLEKLVSDYPDGLLADDAIWMLAELENYQFNDLNKAAEWYKLILTGYPSSIYSQEAREKYRGLKNKDVSSEDDEELN